MTRKTKPTRLKIYHSSDPLNGSDEERLSYMKYSSPTLREIIEKLQAEAILRRKRGLTRDPELKAILRSHMELRLRLLRLALAWQKEQLQSERTKG